MMCSTRLICRLPARDRRWRTWSPEEAPVGRGAVPRGEVRPVREPGHVAYFRQEPGGSGRADAVQVGQRGGGGLEQVSQLFAGGFLALVDALQVADQLGRDPAPGLACRIPRADF